MHKFTSDARETETVAVVVNRPGDYFILKYIQLFNTHSVFHLGSSRWRLSDGLDMITMDVQSLLSCSVRFIYLLFVVCSLGSWFLCDRNICLSFECVRVYWIDYLKDYCTRFFRMCCVLIHHIPCSIVYLVTGVFVMRYSTHVYETINKITLIEWHESILKSHGDNSSMRFECTLHGSNVTPTSKQHAQIHKIHFYTVLNQ